MTKENKPRYLWTFIFLAIVVVALIYYIGTLGKGENISVSQLKDYIKEDSISRVYGSGNYVRILRVDSVYSQEQFLNGKSDYYMNIPAFSVDRLDQWIEEYLESTEGADSPLVSYNFVQPSASFLETILPYLSIIIVVILSVFILRAISSAGNKNMGFGKSKVKSGQLSKIRFSDVAGSEEEKEELKEIVDFLKYPKKFTDVGARIPKGVLLVGAPGTGKTLLAKAIAGESHAPFFSISGSEFVEMFVGVGASRVRDLFENAKQSMPSIVFIDEIDAVGRQRGAGLGGGNDEREQTLNQLLVEMDGFESNEGIIIIAATNRPDVLDPALMRPGRFDRQIYINLPDVKAREKILALHSKNKKLSDEVVLSHIARITSGFSGADLENLLNEAAILAARDNRLIIKMTDITEGVNKVIMGPQRKSHIVTEQDKKLTAYHEAGHAILFKKLKYCDEVQEISIVPRGMAGGYTVSRPETDDNFRTFNKLNDIVASFMGGRIAEQLIIGDISTGAQNDIEQATKIVRKMVTEFGMSKKLGFVNYGKSSEVFIGRDYQTQTQYGERTASDIDQEIRDILQFNYERALKVLQDNIENLHNLAELLLAKNTVYQEEFNMLIDDKMSVKDIIKIMDKNEKKIKEKAEKERKAREESEKAKLKLLRERTIEALRREGIIVKEKPVSELVETENKEKPLKEEDKAQKENKTETKKTSKKTTKKTSASKKTSTKSNEKKSSSKNEKSKK